MSARAKWLGVVGAVIIALGGAAVFFLTQNTPPRFQPRSLPVVAPSVTLSPKPAPGVTFKPTVYTRSVPVKLTIPDIGVTNATVIPEGSTRNGSSVTMNVPPLSGPSASDVGWWDGGFTPGQDGPSVLAGHVNSYAMGNLVFARLGEMKAGMTAVVTLSDGQQVTFTVTQTQEVSKSASFDWTSWWQSTTQQTGPSLILITCGGTFNSGTGHYQDNLIVYLKESVPTG